MNDFEKQLKASLSEIFEDELSANPEIERQIENVVQQASDLKAELENNDDYERELTVESISSKIGERASEGPKWAWNNSIGYLKFWGSVPEGFRI